MPRESSVIRFRSHFRIWSHLRWDLKQIFELAVGEGYLNRNPASWLFVPKEARRPERLVMNLAEVKELFSLLEQREQLIVKLAVLTGMRPGATITGNEIIKDSKTG